jgi:hypothetical protein
MNPQTVLLDRVSTLERAIDAWEPYLTVAICLVVVGLILEYREDIGKLAKSRPFKWSLLGTTIGGILVTLGVGGELWVHVRTSRLGNELRTANGQVVGLLKEQTADASKGAAVANERANEANKRTVVTEAQMDARTLELRAQLATAEAATKASQAKIAEANANAEEARSMAESERTERTRLTLMASPREFNEAEMTNIQAGLDAYRGKTVSIVTYANDIEGVLLGRQMIELLQNGGLRVRDIGPTLPPTGELLRGLYVDGLAGEAEFVGTLRRLFRDRSRIAINDAEPPQRLTPPTGTDAVILIGFKPFPAAPTPTGRLRFRR